MAMSGLRMLLLPFALAGASQAPARLALELAANSSRAERAGVCQGTSSKVDVEFFVMSKCPDAEFCEMLWVPVMQKLGDAVNVRFTYIAQGEPPACMHGPGECDGNKQRLCAQKYASSTSQLLEFARCQEKDRAAIPWNGEGCAQSVGFDMEKFSWCFAGPEGDQLLQASAARARQLSTGRSCTLHVQSEHFCMEDGGWKECTACGNNKVACLLEKVCCMLSSEKRAATAACSSVGPGSSSGGLLELAASR